MKIKYERDYIKYLRAWFKNRKYFVYKVNERFSSGFPDLIILKNGITSYIEVKVNKNAPSALQKATLQELIKYGAKAYLAEQRYEGGESIEIISEMLSNGYFQITTFEVF